MSYEPLITDAELQRMANGIRDNVSRDSAFELLIFVRGTYERELEERLAKTWQPVEDGFSREEVTFQGRHTERVSVAQDWLTVAWRPESGDEYKASVQLPDNLRLCLLVTQEPTL